MFLAYFDIMEFVSLESHKIPKHIHFSERRLKCRAIVQHPVYDMIMNVLLVFNFLALLIKNILDLYGSTKQQVHAWIISEVVIAWLVGAEMIFLFYCFGILHAIKRRNHIKFEIIFQIIIFASFIHFLASGEVELILRSLEIIIILRGLRLLKLFNEFQQWKIIMRTIGALLKPFTTLLLVTYTLFLVFSIVGDRAFGGLANMNAPEIFNDSAIPDSYVEMNFNDLFSSFVTLFALMVVNNWFVIVAMFEAVTGSVWVRVYFLLFYFFSVIVVLNIVVAFAIDMYSSVESINTQKEEENSKQRSKSFLVSDNTTAENISMLYKEDDNDSRDPLGAATKYKTDYLVNRSKGISSDTEKGNLINCLRNLFILFSR